LPANDGCIAYGQAVVTLARTLVKDKGLAHKRPEE
jgi:hypothetical protein